MLALTSAAALAGSANAASGSRSVAAGSRVAGTVETRMVINRFSAAGTQLVGHGKVVSTYRNAAGATMSTSAKPVSLKVATASAPGPCKVLYLELDELDLTLLGLRVFLHSATEGEPITLTLSADSTHGVLGKLFCDLAQTTIATPTTAKTAATALNQRVNSSTVLHTQATLFTPAQAERQTSGVHSMGAASATTTCPVLHLILGPLHLDLLGLIVDLNKVALDIEATSGTTIGDLFCSLVGVGKTPGLAPSGP